MTFFMQLLLHVIGSIQQEGIYGHHCSLEYASLTTLLPHIVGHTDMYPHDLVYRLEFVMSLLGEYQIGNDNSTSASYDHMAY